MNTRLSRFFTLFTILWCMALFTTACTTAWTSEAINIINLLVPAITAALAILTSFGKGVSPGVLASVQSWSNQATVDLRTVAGLIDQYNAADATAKAGLLTEIQTMLQVLIDNLNVILPEVHVDDQVTQDRITAVIATVASEITALINLVPALQGRVTGHAEVKKLMHAVKSPDEFRDEFNEKASIFGNQYRI